jgi:hypothetical protein
MNEAVSTDCSTKEKLKGENIMIYYEYYSMKYVRRALAEFPSIFEAALKFVENETCEDMFSIASIIMKRSSYDISPILDYLSNCKTEEDSYKYCFITYYHFLNDESQNIFKERLLEYLDDILESVDNELKEVDDEILKNHRPFSFSDNEIKMLMLVRLIREDSYLEDFLETLIEEEDVELVKVLSVILDISEEAANGLVEGRLFQSLLIDSVDSISKCINNASCEILFDMVIFGHPKIS